MSGGIDWFRWHHGTVNDPKFGVVAKKASARLGDVLAMWAILLEAASTAEDRGNPGATDFETIDLHLSMEDGSAERIYAAFKTKGMVDEDGRITAWPKRQPKREDGSAERAREWRERKKEESNARELDRTQTNAREEKSGEEKKGNTPPNGGSGSAQSAAPPTSPPAFDGTNAEALNGKSIVPIATNFDLPDEWGLSAEALGFKPPEVLKEAEKWRQYWAVGKGKGKRRSVRGWRQSWSNWLEKAARNHR